MEENNMQQHYYYAQLNETGLCVGLSDLSGEVTADNMILLESYDLTVLGKKYENGVWVETPAEVPEEEPATEPTETQPSNTEIKNLLLEVKEQNLILMEAFAESVEAGLTE